MILNSVNKIRLILRCKKLYFITNSNAYRELKRTRVLEDNYSCCVFVGEYFDSKKNKKITNFSLPLSTIKFKPYSIKAKIQVLYCDFLQLLISILLIFLKRKNLEIIFTSVMNSRSLYILDYFVKNLKVIEWQYKYIYEYLTKLNKNGIINFKYGDFIFRANHKLNCLLIFPESINDKFNRLINYSQTGNIVILHNPNRNLKYWETLNKLIEINEKVNIKYLILIHPKTFERDKYILMKIFENNNNLQNIIFSNLTNFVKEGQKWNVSLCFSLSSSLDFIFYKKKIPVASPLIFNKK